MGSRCPADQRPRASPARDPEAVAGDRAQLDLRILPPLLHPLHLPGAVLDQLERHLKDIGEAEWLALLNARVFLFTREPDVRRLLDAYKTEGQDVIKLKTAALLAACQDRAEVTTSNSGALPRTTGPSRGHDTFTPLATFPANKVATIKEVTVLGGIDDVQPLTSSVIRHQPGGTKRRIWP